MAGVKLGLFEVLESQPRSAKELSILLNCSEQGIAALSDVLVGCGYLRKEGNSYVNTPLTKRWLVPSSPHYVGNYIKFNYDQWKWWSHVEDLIVEGKSIDIHERLDNEKEWRRYLYGMKDIAALTADEVIARVPVPKGAKRLLDLAGGHGMYSITMCRKHSNLQAVIFDLERAARVGQELIEMEGMADRISYKIGDLKSDEFGVDFDIVFLFNILHHFSPGVNYSTLKKIYDAMNPGGVIVILEALKAVDYSNQLALFLSLNFFIMSRADTYRYEEVRDWLQKVGFDNLKKKELRTAPGISIITGRK